jgi:hypothetical protein
MSFNLVGSYFALQWLANIFVAVSVTSAGCTSSQKVWGVATVLGFFSMFGLSIIGTNLLCHRYLCEKARIMIKLYVGRALSSHPAPRYSDTPLHYCVTPQP